MGTKLKTILTIIIKEETTIGKIKIMTGEIIIIETETEIIIIRKEMIMIIIEKEMKEIMIITERRMIIKPKRVKRQTKVSEYGIRKRRNTQKETKDQLKEAKCKVY